MQTVNVPMESLAEIILLQLERGGKASLTVTGNSMRPMLTDRRDTVTLITPNAPQKGDVVLFKRSSGAYVLHRIIDKTQDGYICCGDNQTIHEPVRQDQVIAVVDGFVRNGKSHTTAAPLYRVYTAVWMRLFSLRRLYYICRRRLGRIRRNLRGKNKNI